ncbi:alkyl hydroperoxide reductase/ Thiol specific antioxidant/ Mal allergens family protein [Cyanobium sp. PCC 7001]|uniref:peroxiredoxin n=1 Tax=Cyanobium sp. PCC 7001 TaxID=180281 RepID=UPI0001804EDA|nr:peroxiredoxin [Cyanobium sp. PCC 7001]EDY37188.1 alkyl hydroperoxide reductase/ Thiol specific antioxidant/ Mal allergens family protein [Cyanobium sp. PCC 7001]
MLRRHLLRLAITGAGFLATGLLRPAAARALGGTLPALDQPAPAFRLAGVVPADGGKAEAAELGLEDFRGQWLVLYFYPRDFTSGCTLEARGFQRDLARFRAAGAAVVGVSADDAESHSEFCGSEGLAFPLLSDPGGRVSARYGSWIAPFSQRHTFLIDPQGVLRQRWVAVRPSLHSAEVLTALEALQV